MTRVRIEVQRKSYRIPNRSEPVPALENFRLDLGSGEFVCLVGPSGCGKTTLLNIVAGLDRDFRGSVRIEADSNKRRIGYVFQNPRLLPWRTVGENIALACPGDTDPAYVEHLFEVVGLAEARDAYPERLSLGMSRRAALVRAFALNPDLLIMDEPFVSLDPPTARRIRHLLIRLWRERPHTVLFVTHDLREAIELADRLIFLSPSPARILLDLPVTLLRDGRDDESIEDFRGTLRSEFPALRDLL